MLLDESVFGRVFFAIWMKVYLTREAREAFAQMEEKLANGLRDLEVLRVEASAQP